MPVYSSSIYLKLDNLTSGKNTVKTANMVTKNILLHIFPNLKFSPKENNIIERINIHP